MRCHVIVRGKVQNVGFRWFVRERARALGLAGRVGNRRDGTVEVEAEGEATAIDILIVHLGTGPAGSRVMSVEPLTDATSSSVLPNPFTID